MPATPRTIRLRSEPIELAQLLKFAGVVETGGAAKLAIANGLVSLNGTIETQKGKQIKSGDKVSYDGQVLVVQVGS